MVGQPTRPPGGPGFGLPRVEHGDAPHLLQRIANDTTTVQPSGSAIQSPQSGEALFRVAKRAHTRVCSLVLLKFTIVYLVYIHIYTPVFVCTGELQSSFPKYCSTFRMCPGIQTFPGYFLVFGRSSAPSSSTHPKLEYLHKLTLGFWNVFTQLRMEIPVA